MFILVGALAVLPFLIDYTIFAYKVFGGQDQGTFGLVREAE